MKKILVAMDSMKGCLDSYRASQWVAIGMQEAFPESEVVFTPVSDGGEGMEQMVACGRQDIEICDCKVNSPLGVEINAEWLMIKDKVERCAYIEFASAGGLTLVDEENRNPLDTTSYGVGQMIRDAIKKGIYDIRLGLGGSATVDAGLGALQALGLRLLDKNGRDLPRPFKGRMLADVGDIELTDDFKKKINNLELTLLCDVEAPFTGECGAANVFGPQKGAKDEEVKMLEEGMDNIRKLIIEKSGIDLNLIPGSGAAGGAAGGLVAFVGAKIKKGASTLLDLIGFDNDIEGVDLIITGEGSSDRQTLMGKIPYEILQRGKKKNIPVWLVAGRVRDREALHEAGFERIFCINSPDVVSRSGTLGQGPMDPYVAARRLSSIIKPDKFT
ncbi:MAG: glycerate kinase [Muribaculaceae bacterium]|nr:glycerate kinase [Muribaculaceae bacterium]